jgi:hypothetical protein
MPYKSDWSKLFRKVVCRTTSEHLKQNPCCVSCGRSACITHHLYPEFAVMVKEFGSVYEFDYDCHVDLDKDYIFGGQVIDANIICELFNEFHEQNCNLASVCSTCHNTIHNS